MQPSKEFSEFNKWTVNLDHFSLINKYGDEIFVEPRLLKLLSLLTANPNRVVKRNELIDQIWEDVVVTEESLSKAVFDLRKFLNEKFTDAPQIVTIRKVGYKLELKTETTPSQSYRLVRLAARVLIYTFIAFVLFVIIVRAVRYEN